MSSLTYKDLALGWSPESKRDHTFNLIAIVVVSVMLGIGIVFSFIQVPKEDRKARTVVPERIAKFITQKPKQKPKPKVEVKPPPPPKPRIQRKRIENKKPLTKKQVKARNKAEKSGLLALGKELSDLIDTSSVDLMVGKKVRRSSVGSKATKIDTAALTSNATKGSGGVGQDKYATSVSQTTLTASERKAIRQALASGSIDSVAKSKTNRSRIGDNFRSEEDITFVMDQNKSKLHSIYRRARRKNPGLKGKIVFKITIASSGQVTKVIIKSSELNDPALEQRLLVRIKGFNFGERNVEKVTVTFPLEFLPS